jgi:hypothetical protein
MAQKKESLLLLEDHFLLLRSVGILEFGRIGILRIAIVSLVA